MSRVNLCLGQYARTPYTFEKARTRVFCVEELCYFLKENAWLLDEAVLGKGLADWLEKECALPELAARFRAMVKGKAKVEELVTLILDYTGYYDEKKTAKLKRLLQASADVSMVEKQKARADYFLAGRRYALAIREYLGLLSREEEMLPSLRGRIYHNLGSAQAGLFLFEKAAASFEQAYRLNAEAASLRCLLAARRMYMSEAEYLEYLTENETYYDASLELENQVAERKQQWTDVRNESVLASIRSAFFAGEEAECSRLMEEETERLKDAYRDYVAQ